MTTMTMEHETLDAALNEVRSAMTTSELHGEYCGVLCAGGSEAASTWLDNFIRETEAPEVGLTRVREVLQLMEVDTWRALASTDLNFAPLLPDDDAPLDDRVGELALWCHGFLLGLTLAGWSSPADAAGEKTQAAPKDSRVKLEEIVSDFSEISRAGLSATERDDPVDADYALAELVEYARVGVQIVFEEIGDARGREAGRRGSMSEH